MIRKLLPLLSLCGLNHFLVWLCRVTESELAESTLRGVRYLRRLKAEFPLHIGRNVLLKGCENIKFGKNVVLFDNVYLNTKQGKGNFIKIGNNTTVDVFTSIWGEGGVEIGDGCTIAAGVRIYSQSNQYDYEPNLPVINQPIKYARVKIGDDVWIGANAVILPGVEIGSHSVIGAGAIVLKNVPSYSIAVGVPAKVVKQREIA